jgi:hypothetical protein
MTFEELIRSAPFLPISENALSTVLDDIIYHHDLPSEEYLSTARYAIRTIAAILPPEKMNIIEIANLIELDERTPVIALTRVLMSHGPFEGEVNVMTLRTLLGLIDDGVDPVSAGQHLGINEHELELLEEYLGLRAHWASRIYDRIEVILHDGGGFLDVARTLGMPNLWHAWRLTRWVRHKSRRD